MEKSEQPKETTSLRGGEARGNPVERAAGKNCGIDTSGLCPLQ